MIFPDETNPEEDVILSQVIDLAKTCESEYEHVIHVSKLTLRLFDELAEWHHLRHEDRFILQCAAILHDIGWVEGWKNHHKTALRIILETKLLPFDHHNRLIIGSIARYHRKALPVISHDHFASMNPADRKRVQILASFLRLADGLDRTHRGKIRDLACKIKKNRILIFCSSAFPAVEEWRGGIEKSDLLSLVTDKEIQIKIVAL
ncbi:HD domain-containing protein [Leptolinea tardivitalis]|uniref:HD domain-containing protein n=1 Tax=Leptolinea tardivitalis TaxID=229920 RepID=UPI000782AB56|nr:HD domain-containing protein [Leptolinea tardivitalis]GAP20929.1 exopolyphosphatase [Leptolinea tardivitalis]